MQWHSTARNGTQQHATDAQRNAPTFNGDATTRTDIQRAASTLNEPHRHSTNRNDTQRAVVVDELGLSPFRRCAIHTLRLRGNRPEIVNYFGRWSAPDGSKMSVLYDKLCVQESLAASEIM